MVIKGILPFQTLYAAEMTTPIWHLNDDKPARTQDTMNALKHLERIKEMLEHMKKSDNIHGSIWNVFGHLFASYPDNVWMMQHTFGHCFVTVL